ncbi:MAG: ribonuclease R [Bacteroidota bacterium]
MSKKKKTKVKGKKLAAHTLRVEIKKLFKRNAQKRFNAKQIIRKMKIANSRDSVNDALEKLAEKEVIRSLGGDKFKLNLQDINNGSSKEKQIYEGRVDMTRSGSAYIVIDGLEDDIHVSSKLLKTALNGDIVKINTWKPRGRYKPEGEVLEVVSRASEYFIGTFSKSRKYGFVMPDKLNMPVDIIVFPDDQNDASDGDKVVVKVKRWHDQGNKSPVGIITSVLGKSGSSDIEMKSILINNGFNLEFPEEVLAETNQFPEGVDEAEANKRRDMRHIATFTIDPVDAKDFDDALSIEYFDDGSCEIGIHIADVTHYLKPKTALDKEAYLRSTSVYLVDRVLPMLPEKLSNGLCSLRPNEDKYTFSAVFKFDEKDKIVGKWFGKTLTHSNRRFAYGEAQKVMETGEGDMAKELGDMKRIARKLRKQLFKEGAIAFESEEVRFKLDEDGVPIEVYVKQRREANMLIEDFMLLANKEVATFVNKKEKPEIPFVYRVHDLPNPDKVAEFARFAYELGVQLKTDTPQQIAQSYNELAKKAEANDALKLLQPIAIRTMAKAEYSTENIGHYGLGFEFYSHFTSPIRRYSDVLAHRILYQVLEGQNYRLDKEKLEAQCKHISIMERKATDAERESIKYKQVEFIKNNIGEAFDGVISGIIDRGIFVELVHSKCEGMVGFDTMDEPFDIKDGRLKAVGLRTGTTYKMGDTVRVVITNADLQRRQIDMELET